MYKEELVKIANSYSLKCTKNCGDMNWTSRNLFKLARLIKMYGLEEDAAEFFENVENILTKYIEEMNVDKTMRISFDKDLGNVIMLSRIVLKTDILDY